MINIYLNDGNLTIPKDETCYIIAKGGMYLKKKLDLVESLTPVDKISFLEDIPTYASLDIPKIPVRLFGGIVGFFRQVYKLYKSEAIVLLFYNKSKKTYKVYIPKQEVSSCACTYTADKTIKDHILIGSIHSHASMSAFHSGTDVGDEAKFDGLHMTIGKLDEELFDIVGSIAINALRVPISPETYVEGLEVREFTKFFPQMFRPSFQVIEGVKEYLRDVKPSTGYTLVSSDVTTENIFWFNKDWLRRVSEKKYEYSGYEYWNAYPGLATTKRYIIRNGKLVEIKPEEKGKKDKHKNKHQQPDYSGYNFYDSDYYKNLLNTRNDDVNVDDTDDNDKIQKCEHCSDCIYRNEKLNLEEVNKLPQQSCMDNHQLDFSMFDNKWGW